MSQCRSLSTLVVQMKMTPGTQQWLKHPEALSSKKCFHLPICNLRTFRKKLDHICIEVTWWRNDNLCPNICIPTGRK